MDLVPWPSSEYEAGVDLVLIQTSLALSWKFSSKNTYQHKKNLIYIIKQESLYQNKVNSSLASIYKCNSAPDAVWILYSLHRRGSKGYGASELGGGGGESFCFGACTHFAQRKSNKTSLNLCGEEGIV